MRIQRNSIVVIPKTDFESYLVELSEFTGTPIEKYYLRNGSYSFNLPAISLNDPVFKRQGLTVVLGDILKIVEKVGETYYTEFRIVR